MYFIDYICYLNDVCCNFKYGNKALIVTKIIFEDEK